MKTLSLMISAVFALLLIPAAAFADDQGGAKPSAAGDSSQTVTMTPSDSVTPPKPGPEDIVCHREQVTGSHMGRVKVCLPRSKWDNMTDVGVQGLRHNEREQNRNATLQSGG